MVKFERRDPFPHLPIGSFSKSEAQTHAADVDAWLGLRVESIEESLRVRGSKLAAPSTSSNHQQLWFGLEPRDLQTPYFEIRSILESVLPKESAGSVIDLGAAYSRMGFVVERHFPLATFRGFEYVGERVNESRLALARFGAKRASVEHVDLTSPRFQMPAADLYFVYDYGTPAAIEKTLFDLQRVARRSAGGRKVIIVARGRVCRYAIESRHANWLKRQDVSAPERAFTIYESDFNMFVGVDRIEPTMQNDVHVIDRADHAQGDRQV